ncbi:MAG: cell division protein FtsQ/DivIB [Aestuariibacter sp.]
MTAIAMTEEHNIPSRAQHLGGLLFLILVVLLIVVLAWQVMTWLEDKQRVPLQQVLVSGQTTYLDIEKIEKQIRRRQPVSFFRIDVNQAHQDIEELPWVYQASVRKQWPDTLQVYVIEQAPVARWNGDSLLNRFGGTFTPDMDINELPLPNLYGPGGSELTALQGYKAMQGLLKRSGLQIEELFLSERYAWNVKLNNGVNLNLGRQEFMDRLQRFIDVFPLLKKHNKSVSYVDLRYDTGLAVGWSDD